MCVVVKIIYATIEITQLSGMVIFYIWHSLTVGFSACLVECAMFKFAAHNFQYGNLFNSCSPGLIN